MMPRQFPLDFLLLVPLREACDEISVTSQVPSLEGHSSRKEATLYLSSETKFRLMNENGNMIAVGGDPVGFDETLTRTSLKGEFSVERFVRDVPGHYYLLYFNGMERKLLLSASLFNMFPIFWHRFESYLLVASRLNLILSVKPSLKEPNKKFVMEQILFNYPLFGDTLLKGVYTCPTNHYVKVEKGNVDFVRHMSIADLFVDRPRSWKEAADELTSLFIKRFEAYTVNDRSMISFTGGFDGRTLVACSHFYRQEFSTFSFGTMNNEDVLVPQDNAKKLGIDHESLLLDTGEYIENDFYTVGEELVDVTSSLSNLLYVHFLYSAKKLCSRSKYFLTGYFGSELFRALHLAGAISSRELVTFFEEKKEDKWIDEIRSSPKLRVLAKGSFPDELDETIHELRSYRASNLDRFDTLNKFFYQYVYEEILSKIFGPHIYSQSNYVNVRTPFLDLALMKGILGTEVAGVNNDFFTHNPLKRSKGQYLYARIIDKAYPELSSLKMQRGYRPRDLLNFRSRLKVVLPFFAGKIRRKIEKPNLDNLSIISGLRFNWGRLDRAISRDLYDAEELNRLIQNIDALPEHERDILTLAVSTSLFLIA